MEKLVKKTIRMPEDLYDELAEQSKKEDRAISATIRVAVKEYLERKKLNE